MSQQDDKTAKINANKDNSIAERVIHNVFTDGISSGSANNIIEDEIPSSTHNVAGFNRRRFMKVFGSVGVTAVGASSLGLVGCSDDDDDANTNISGAVSFDHGVASGDPLSDKVILWTRVTPQRAGSFQPVVKWVLGRDPQMRDIVKQGEVTTSVVKDYTVKVDINGLQPNTIYYYQFVVGNTVSRIGKTKTLPVGNINQVKMAVFSCANYPAGFFHVYADAAKRNDLDVCVHLGDYIYEYARTITNAQGNTVPAYASANAAAIDREVLPEQEVVSVNEYRARYAQYRSDPPRSRTGIRARRPRLRDRPDA